MLVQHSIAPWKNYCCQSEKDLVLLLEFLGSLSVLSGSLLLYSTWIYKIASLLSCGQGSSVKVISALRFPIAASLLFACLWFFFFLILFPAVFYLTRKEKVHSFDICWISFSELGLISSFQLFHDLGAFRLYNKMKITDL